MPVDKSSIALNILIGLILVLAAGTFAYRHFFYGDADPIAKFLCGDSSVATGKYDACMEHYKQ
jgi:hypothetical protein